MVTLHFIPAWRPRAHIGTVGSVCGIGVRLDALLSHRLVSGFETRAPAFAEFDGHEYHMIQMNEQTVSFCEFLYTYRFPVCVASPYKPCSHNSTTFHDTAELVLNRSANLPPLSKAEFSRGSFDLHI